MLHNHHNHLFLLIELALCVKKMHGCDGSLKGEGEMGKGGERDGRLKRLKTEIDDDLERFSPA